MASIINPIIMGGDMDSTERLYRHTGATNPVTTSYTFTKNYAYVLVVSTGAEGTNQNPRATISYDGSGQIIIDDRNVKKQSVMLSAIFIKDVTRGEKVSFNGTWHTVFDVYGFE